MNVSFQVVRRHEDLLNAKMAQVKLTFELNISVNNRAPETANEGTNSSSIIVLVLS